VQTPETRPGEAPRLLYVVTSAADVAALRGQLRYMTAAGFDVTVVSGPGPELEEISATGSVATVSIPMSRGFTPLHDGRAFLRLRRLMRQRRPDIVNVSTPKAALLAGLAARAAGVPVRVYAVSRLRYQQARGLRRWLLCRAEHTACSAAHLCVCASESVRKTLELEEMVEAQRSLVLGSGSSNGVDADRFAPTGERVVRGRRLRVELGIAEDAPVYGFVGALTPAKGLPELVAAHETLKKVVTGVRLLLVGAEDPRHPLPPETRAAIQNDASIVATGFVPDCVPYFHALDLLALPSHGEGFPTVILEAYAAGKPVVATRVIGVVDAVMEEGTGLLVPLGDRRALEEAIESLLKSPDTRRDMGDAGRRWVVRDFRPLRLWRDLEKLYRRLLAERGLALPAREGVTTGVLTAGA
jgi:glycosyltransferase involved in cell wall biosynthesis